MKAWSRNLSAASCAERVVLTSAAASSLVATSQRPSQPSTTKSTSSPSGCDVMSGTYDTSGWRSQSPSARDRASTPLTRLDSVTKPPASRMRARSRWFSGLWSSDNATTVPSCPSPLRRYRIARLSPAFAQCITRASVSMSTTKAAVPSVTWRRSSSCCIVVKLSINNASSCLSLQHTIQPSE